MDSDFDALVGAPQAAEGQNAFVEILRADDQGTVAELHGRLGRIVHAEDRGQGGRGVGWMPIGEQPVADRGTGFPIDQARFQSAEVLDGIVRGVFDGLTYSVVVTRSRSSA